VKAMLDRHQQGWSSSFERLARIAQG
jgi:hypothetical protein